MEFGGKPEITPYLDAYGPNITGSRGEGNVRGVKLVYESETECQAGDLYSLEIAVECDDENELAGKGKILRVDQ